MNKIDGLLGRHSGQQAPLLRRAKHEHTAAEVVAEPGQLAEILDRMTANGGVGMCDVEALGLRQKPVEPHAIEARAGDRAAHLAAGGRGKVGGKRREREGRDLDPAIPGGGREVAGLCQRPVAEGLVADRVAEGSVHRWPCGGDFGSSTFAGRPVRAER